MVIDIPTGLSYSVLGPLGAAAYARRSPRYSRTLESALDAQLRAVRRLRSKPPPRPKRPSPQGMSDRPMTYSPAPSVRCISQRFAVAGEAGVFPVGPRTAVPWRFPCCFLSSCRSALIGGAPLSARCEAWEACWETHIADGADYLARARKWRPQELFAPVWKRALGFCRSRLVGVAIDDTRLRKTGRRIKQAFYQHDPLSPPFHANLMLGLRYLQASLLVPFDRGGKTGARALPVRFECAPVPKRPGKRAGDAEREQYEQARKRCHLATFR